MNKPIIIAECCQNHNGDIYLLEQMVVKAAASGADYAKIQSIRSQLLTNRPRFNTGETSPDGQVMTIKRPYQNEFDRLKLLDLSRDEEKLFIEMCRDHKIRAMTTVFAKETVEDIAPLGFDAIKIASYDCGSVPLLKLCLKLRKPLFVSTGASTNAEIVAATELLRHVDACFLHCVTIYPTPKCEFHLARLNFLRMFADSVGLSSHPLNARDGITPDIVALALGADCIERHFTVLDASESRDGPVSITPGQLQELSEFAQLPLAEKRAYVRDHLSGWEVLLGCADRDLSKGELLNRDYYRGRFASRGINGRWDYNWEE